MHFSVFFLFLLDMQHTHQQHCQHTYFNRGIFTALKSAHSHWVKQPIDLVHECVTAAGRSSFF